MHLNQAQYSGPSTKSQSPWGKVETVHKLFEGAWVVTTASHGGIKLDPKRNREMPEAFRKKGGWYEEDCESSFIVLAYRRHFNDAQYEIAEKTIKNYFPDQYETWSGKWIPLDESKVKRDRHFDLVNNDKWVGIAAVGDWHPDVPKGMVGVTATIGGDMSHDNNKSFLVPVEEYQARTGRFVVDPAKHQTISTLALR